MPTTGPSIRIATRKSPLAMWQARHVAQALQRSRSDIKVSFVALDTQADQRLDISIAELGGKGAFAKEIQHQVLTGRADIAVHSGKDLQAVTPEGLSIGAVLERGEPRDCLVGALLHRLPKGATVATGSNRRRVQLSLLRPDLTIVGIRGNIGTRLSKLGEIDAIVMAKVALERLDIDSMTVDVFEPIDMIPQVAQGAVLVECRSDDAQAQAALAAIDHAPSRRVVEAERAFLVELGGDCDLPAGAHCTLDAGGALRMRALLASPEGDRVERVVGSGDDPSELGHRVARTVRSQLNAT